MSGPFIPRQLVLDLDHSVSFAREDFLSGPSNIAALTLIERWPDWPSRMVALTGPEGSGKSHLAAIWADESGARELSAKFLSIADVPGTLATGALVVEDLEAEDLDEHALFHLINLAREEDAYVLLTSRNAVASLPVTIRDLASRLRALPAVIVTPPDDVLLRSLLIKLASDRQLALDESVINFLVNRIDRSFAAARNAIQTLDDEAMRRHRPVTRALAVELFRSP
ncbi:MAG TPA: DnaA/Hda family protein [Pseudolabrys sp.]|nr:DnaA/Hda family protein [Pseudolabrys sp.]